MKRRLDWPERMNDALDEARGKAFSETYCCAIFAADVVKAMTGVDPLSPEERSAPSVASLYALMRETHDTLLEALESLLGAQRPVALAHRGDVVLRSDEAGEALGICCGQRTAFISDDGLEFLPTRQMTAAFRVPY